MRSWIHLVIALSIAQGCMVKVPISTRPISGEVRAPPPDPKEGQRKTETPEPTELAAAAEGEKAPTPGTPQAAGIGDGVPGNLGEPAGDGDPATANNDAQPPEDAQPGKVSGGGITVPVPAAPAGGEGPESDGAKPGRAARATPDVAPSFDPFRAPGEVPVRWSPFKQPKVLVVAPGYRRMTIPLKVGIGALWGRPHPIELVLIPNHGPSGTWTEEEAP